MPPKHLTSAVDRRTLCAALFSAPLLAQIAPKKRASKTPDIEPKKITIDAIVTGAGGNLERGLTAADFEIQQDGEKQKILSVTLVEAKAGSTPGAPSGGPVRWAGMALSPNERTILVLVIDDLQLSAQAMSNIRGVLGRLINERLTQGQYLAIVPISGGPAFQQQITTGKAQLLEAVRAIPFHPEVDESAAGQERSETCALTAILSLQGILRGLRNVPGRKNVLFFSENMWLYKNPQALSWFGGLDEHGLKTRLDAGEIASLSSDANLSQVVFYSSDPRALSADPKLQAAKEQIEIYSGLGRLAKDTGGIFFDNTNDATRVVERVEQELSGYYRIVFNSTVSNPSGAMRFLRADVKVLRDGLNVRTRTGSLKADDQQEGFDPGKALVEIMDQVASPFAFGDLHLGLSQYCWRSQTGEAFVDILVPIRMADLSYELQKDGIRHCSVEIVVALVDQHGAGNVSVSKGFEINLKPQEYEKVIRYGLPIRTRLRAKTPGVYQVIAAVRDLTSGKIGSVRQFLAVDEINSGRFRIVGLAVGGNQMGFAVDVTPEAKADNTLLGLIVPGQQLTYTYQLFNPTVGPDKFVRLEASAQLYRNGSRIFASEPSAAVKEATSKALRLTISGKINFKEDMPAGDYSLLITARDTQAKGDSVAKVHSSVNFVVKA